MGSGGPAKTRQGHSSGGGLAKAKNVSSAGNLYDFAEQDRSRAEELSEYNLRVGLSSGKAHMEEQRRRLEHFLQVARQARARSDIKKIEELLEELLTSGKSLSHPRINELKHLEVMTSPYNQTLLSMLKLENHQLRRFKEQLIRDRAPKSRFTLPKDHPPSSSDGAKRSKLRSSQERSSKLTQGLNCSDNYPMDN